MEIKRVIVLGIDLDETLIAQRNPYITSTSNHPQDWYINKSAKKYLPLIAKELSPIFHLITAREQSVKVEYIVKFIEKTLGIKFMSVNYTDYQAKGHISHKLGCDFLIDDYQDYIKDCHEYLPSTLPLWFKVKKQSRANTLKYPAISCHSWLEVYLFLKDFQFRKHLAVKARVREVYHNNKFLFLNYILVVFFHVNTSGQVKKNK